VVQLIKFLREFKNNLRIQSTMNGHLNVSLEIFKLFLFKYKITTLSVMQNSSHLTIILCSSVIKIVISQKQKFNRNNNNDYYFILLYSCHIVWKFLNIDTEHNTQQSQNAEARRR
jgi:hypothetical protein